MHDEHQQTTPINPKKCDTMKHSNNKMQQANPHHTIVSG
jgi:hypothetical protein